MTDILEAITDYIPDVASLDVKYDEELFERLLNFIIELDPEQLGDEQLDTVESILDELEMFGEDGVSEIRLSKRSSAEKRRKSRQFYRRNRQKIKIRRKKFKRSAAGRKRKRLTKMKAKSGKTATGRRKVRYHI